MSGEMTQDIYTNTSAFGLMSDEMQAQMKAHPGAWEYYSFDGWLAARTPTWTNTGIYRAVRPPEPPKVYEAWAVAPADDSYLSYFQRRAAAEHWAATYGGTVIHMTGSKKDE